MTRSRRLLLFLALPPLVATPSGCTPTAITSATKPPQPAPVVAVATARAAVAAVTPTMLTPDERSTSKASTIAEAVVAAVKPHGTNLRRLTAKYDGDEALPAPGVTIDVLPQDTPSVVHALQKQIGPGYLVFVSERSFDFGKRDSVSVLRVAEPFEALRVMGTNGANHDISVDDILARLRKWDAAYGLRLYGVGYDWLEAEFVRQPPDMKAFAAEVYAFCPDVVDQGTSTVSALASEMERSNSVALWWD